MGSEPLTFRRHNVPLINGIRFGFTNGLVSGFFMLSGLLDNGQNKVV